MRNMFIKSIGVLLIFCLICGSAYARTDIYTTNEANGSVTLNIKTNAKSADYATVVTVPGKTINDITQTAPWKVLPIQIINNAGNVMVKSESLGIPSGNGAFTAYVSGADMNKNAVTRFAVGASSSVINTALGSLNAQSSSEALAQVLNNVSYNNIVWCVDSSMVNNTSVKNAFAGLKQELYPNGFTSSNDVEKCFRMSCALAEFIQADNGKMSELAIWYKDDFGLDLTQASGLSHISDGKASIETAFNNLKKDSVLNPITNVAQLKDILEKSEAMGMLNDATRDNMANVWNTYGKALGLKADNGSWINSDFTFVNSYELAKLIERNSERPDFTNLADIKAAFDTAIRTLKAQMQAGNNNGPSGNNSGSLGVSGNLTMGNEFAVTDPGSVAGTKGNEAASTMFKDLPLSHWACMQIEYAANNGIVKGDGNGNFRPEDKVTRAEFIQMIVNAFDLERPATGTPDIEFLENNGTKEPPKAESFSDVPEDAWFYTAVDWGSKAGVINGYDDGRFGVSDNITREDAATILLRVKEACAIAINTKVAAVDFTDEQEISDYAKEAVKELQAYDVIKGYSDGTFNPKGEITRAETVSMIYTMLRVSNSL